MGRKAWGVGLSVWMGLSVLGLVCARTPATQAQVGWVPRAPPVKPEPAHQLRDPASWPEEPTAAAHPINAEAFAHALAQVCGVTEARLVRRLRTTPLSLIKAASDAEVDAFALAALVADRSACHGRRQEHGEVGLLGLQPRMYLRARNAPLPVARKDLRADRLLASEHNLKVGAQLLRMWQDKHLEIDAKFKTGAAHRSGLAHMFWGDRVMSSGGEDRVYTIRRRMLQLYQGLPRTTSFSPQLAILVASPLDGAPRVATSGLGEPRDGGRWHRGLDITGAAGENVKAIADGVVTFAGVNLANRPRFGPVSAKRIRRYRHHKMGAGGIYVCIAHEAPREVVSCYMHLNRYFVNVGQHVQAAERIGELGETGIVNSLAHLHLEIRHEGQAANVADVLAPFLIPPQATLTHHLLKQRLRQARRQQVRARGATREL